MDFEQIKDQYQKLNIKKELLQTDLNKSKKRKNILSKDLESYEIAREGIKKIAKETQEKLIYHVSDIINLLLSSVFENNTPVFSMKIEERRNKTEIDLLIDDTTPINKGSKTPNFGGGVLDIVSIGLRLALWSMEESAKIFILDEPTRNLDENKQSLASEMFKMLSKKHEIQFIIVSHREEMKKAADKILEIRKKNKTSYIK